MDLWVGSVLAVEYFSAAYLYKKRAILWIAIDLYYPIPTLFYLHI